MTTTRPAGVTSGEPAEPPASLTARLAAWAHAVTYEDIPAATLAAARSQLISNLAAVRASLRHPAGRAIVAAFGPPLRADPTRSACVLAALASALDFDEVAYGGHVSTGGVNVAIAHAGVDRLDGRALLTTIVTANECAARITAATILSPFFRGQTNTHCHLAGAAAARLRARDAAPGEWVAGLGLALGTLPVPLHHAVVTSDVKALSAAASVRMALDGCDAAAHGLTGPAAILEHPEGLLAALSAVPLPEIVTTGLGRRWHTDTLTYKRFPGSAYLHAAFDCAERLHRRLGAVDVSRVRRVVVHGSLLTWQMEQKVARELDGPRTNVSAATLSVGYGVATLLMTGAFGPGDLTPSALADPERWALAEKVVVEHDMDLSIRMAQATSPLGESLRRAGDRALDWPEFVRWTGDAAPALLAALGGPEETFEQATMAIGARVAVELADGTAAAESRDAFVGSAGPETRRDHGAIVARKFLSTGGPRDVLAELEHLDALGPEQVVAVLARAVEDLPEP
ncbi:MmgE/PrpD family protein [Microbispora bryophytorum]|uniref:MmgE/PrpD family protein n=1 Tax=Microbispora bryophytorum TaxID=1460882 RepID=UPI0033F2640C